MRMIEVMVRTGCCWSEENGNAYHKADFYNMALALGKRYIAVDSAATDTTGVNIGFERVYTNVDAVAEQASIAYDLAKATVCC